MKIPNIKVGNELLDNSFLCHGFLDKHIGRLQIIRCAIFLDEQWVARYGRAVLTGPRDGCRARYRGQFVHVEFDGGGTEKVLTWTTQGRDLEYPDFT